MLPFILPSSSRARTSLGFEGKKIWNNRHYPGMERTEYYHKGSNQLHSKLNEGIRIRILGDRMIVSWGRAKALFTLNAKHV